MAAETYYKSPMVYIKKPNGVHCYNMQNMQHKLLPALPPELKNLTPRNPEHFVPALCAQCYGSVEEDYEEVRKGISADSSYLLGMAGTCDTTAHDYDPSLYPSTSAGDMDKESFPKYHLDYDNAKYMCHVAPGKVLWRHAGEEIGNVVCYWHVHTPTSCGVNALVKLDAEKQNARVALAQIMTAGFSWTTTVTGEKDIIVELSAVHLPARPGCFATHCKGAEETLGLMEKLNFRANVLLQGEAPLNGILEILKAKNIEMPAELTKTKESFDDPKEYVALLEEYAKVLFDKSRMLEVMYKKKGECVAETHIKLGAEKFQTINGEKASNSIVKNKVLTAQAEPSAPAAEVIEMAAPAPAPVASMQQPPAQHPCYQYAPPPPSHMYAYPPVPTPSEPRYTEESIAKMVLEQLEKKESEARKRKKEEEMNESLTVFRTEVAKLKEEMGRMQKSKEEEQAAAKVDSASALIKQVASASVGAPANHVSGITTQFDLERVMKILTDCIIRNMESGMFVHADAPVSEPYIEAAGKKIAEAFKGYVSKQKSKAKEDDDEEEEEAPAKSVVKASAKSTKKAKTQAAVAQETDERPSASTYTPTANELETKTLVDSLLKLQEMVPRQ
ncbi:ORF88 [Ranid herpesvirus 2]|uniref:ORF88 n=1 Tax=Ranid herpesvirus 2 TaxID=389214 RepID=Q14W18_9VIRU|nr:ORF88 [Ranid herpesvirus 2]ABG25593.1 ORF88 [Ranid herpesvirus 2]